MIGAVIKGTGSYVPETILSNDDLERMVETSDSWIRERTGMVERRIAAEGEATSDLAIRAGRRALEDAGVSPEDVDLVIVSTSSPDFVFPPSACLVQAALGCTNAGAFDVMATCTGFITALSVAEGYIKSGRYSNILVIGADALTRLVDKTDRSTVVLFGDGAGAVLLQAEEGTGRGIISTYLKADGEYWDLIYVPAGGTRHPASNESVAEGLHFIKMEGNRVFRLAVQRLAHVLEENLKRTGLQAEQIDFLIPHQANLRIIDALAKHLKFPREKLIVNIEKYGNTSSATIPLALDEARREGRVKTGDLLAFAAFGAGLTSGSLLARL